MKFNVGDRVRVTDRHDHDEDFVHAGDVGVIAEIEDRYHDPDSDFYHSYRVVFAHELSDWLSAQQLELVTTTPVYKLTVPPEPNSSVTQVRVVGKSVTYKQCPFGWTRDLGTGGVLSWRELLTRYPEGVEPVSDYDVAVAWFRSRYVLDSDNCLTTSTGRQHALAIIGEAVKRSD